MDADENRGEKCPNCGRAWLLCPCQSTNSGDITMNNKDKVANQILDVCSFEKQINDLTFYPYEYGINFVLIGLAGEVGEVAEVVITSDYKLADIFKEFADCLNYLIMIFAEIKMSLSDFMVLASRKETDNYYKREFDIERLVLQFVAAVGMAENAHKKVMRGQDRNQKFVDGLALTLNILQKCIYCYGVSFEELMRIALDKALEAREKHDIRKKSDGCPLCHKTAMNCHCQKATSGDVVGQTSPNMQELPGPISNFEEAEKALTEIYESISTRDVDRFLDALTGRFRINQPFRKKIVDIDGDQQTLELSKIRRLHQRLSNAVEFYERGPGN